MHSMCRVLFKAERLQCATKAVNLHVRLTQIVTNTFHVVGPATAKLQNPIQAVFYPDTVGLGGNRKNWGWLSSRRRRRRVRGAEDTEKRGAEFEVPKAPRSEAPKAPRGGGGVWGGVSPSPAD